MLSLHEGAGPMSSSNPRFHTAPETVLPAEVQELASALAQLPSLYRQELEPIVERVIQGAHRRRQILTLVQEALAQLRLDMKYLIFDLEATRRERDTYRKLLEDSK